MTDTTVFLLGGPGDGEIVQIPDFEEKHVVLWRKESTKTEFMYHIRDMEIAGQKFGIPWGQDVSYIMPRLIEGYDPKQCKGEWQDMNTAPREWPDIMGRVYDGTLGGREVWMCWWSKWDCWREVKANGTDVGDRVNPKSWRHLTPKEREARR